MEHSSPSQEPVALSESQSSSQEKRTNRETFSAIARDREDDIYFASEPHFSVYGIVLMPGPLI
jgi:hypothetical protein